MGGGQWRQVQGVGKSIPENTETERGSSLFDTRDAFVWTLDKI